VSVEQGLKVFALGLSIIAWPTRRVLTRSVDKDGLAREDSMGRDAEADRVMHSHPHSHDDDFLFEPQRDRSEPWHSKPWFRTVEKTEVASPDDGEPTVTYRRRKWKVSIVDETDVTITVRVRPLRVMNPVQFTFPFRSEFNSFHNLATEAVDRYLSTTPISKSKRRQSRKPSAK
jgi:hypothetical protein